MRSAAAYSFSRVTTFEQCPRRFRYHYLDGVHEAFRGIEAFMGQQVHAAIEWMFGERERGRRCSAGEAITHYCRLWDEEIVGGVPAVRVVKDGKSVESYRRAGAEMLARYHETRFVSDRLTTIANERHFVVRVGGRHDFQGYIDRLARDAGGTLHIIDYKTGARTPRGFEGKDADQLRAYALAVFLESDEEQVDLVLEFLRSGRVHRERVERRQMDRLEAELAARIDVVEHSTVFPPNPGVLCSWCGYNDICDALPAGRVRVA